MKLVVILLSYLNYLLIVGFIIVIKHIANKFLIDTIPEFFEVLLPNGPRVCFKNELHQLPGLCNIDIFNSLLFEIKRLLNLIFHFD